MFLAPIQSSFIAPLATRLLPLSHTIMTRIPRAKFSTNRIPQSELAKFQKMSRSNPPVVRFSTGTDKSDETHEKIKERLAALEKLSNIEPTDFKDDVSFSKKDNSTSSIVEILHRIENLERKNGSAINNSDSESNSKYVKVCNTVFNKHKIRSAHVRDSYFYIKYPYILEVAYQQPHTEALIGNEHVKIPITSDTTNYQFKYTHKQDAEKDCERLLASKPR